MINNINYDIINKQNQFTKQRSIKMSSTHLITRAKDCNIIKNATDKPIELLMHHYNTRSLIINLETGDVLSYLFDTSGRISMSALSNTGVTQLEHKTFMSAEGDKTMFMLKTNQYTPIKELSREEELYVSKMKEFGVSFSGLIVADIVGDYKDFEEYRFGEIPTSFIIDLKNPSKFSVFYEKVSGSDIQQNVIKEVGQEKSMLPDIEELTSLYFKYSNIGKLISWADDRLPMIVKESNVNLSALIDLNPEISGAMIAYMKSDRPLSADHLYEENNQGSVLKTLSFLKSEKLNPVYLSYLYGIYAKEIMYRIMDLENEDSNFLPLVSMAKTVMELSEVLLRELEDKEIKENCDLEMHDEISRLKKCIMFKFKKIKKETLPIESQLIAEDFLTM